MLILVFVLAAALALSEIVGLSLMVCCYGADIWMDVECILIIAGLLYSVIAFCVEARKCCSPTIAVEERIR